MNLLLQVKDLTKSYGEKQVVQKINFSMKEGEILGFIGPNGAGKSTTIKMIIDVESKEEGAILFQGIDTKNAMKNFKQVIGVVPQDIAVYDDLSAYDNVCFFCSLYGYKGMDLKARVQEALEFVGLWERRKELPTKFSGGMKRRLNIACSIAHAPKLLIMDEPTVGIDPQSRNHIMESIKALNDRGTSVIYVSHYMEEIDSLCNRIIIMDHGQIIEDMEKSELKDKYRKQGVVTLEEIFLHLTGTELRDEEV
ncbi:MAG: multidrug transport system ATPase [Herbinix sp.]|jgi:ABC-2 type transport system ATP-binding protein|nr:multidrug transport system ATPase [Herbinix sp.]